MNSDRAHLVLLSDGVAKFDGGAIFGQIPKVVWEQKATSDRRNRVTLGLNCLLIQNNGHVILVDTGVGTKEPDGVKDHYGLGTSRLTRELKNRGLVPRDITDVILTNLHFDHCGGSTRFARSGAPVPTFPAATYHVQSAAWDEATNPDERAKGSYHTDDFLPLNAHHQISLLDGDAEIAPGVRVKVTGGHSDGHQMVLVNYGGERVAFLGDLIPTPHHLDLSYIASYDQFPNDTLSTKRMLLDEAERGGWLLLFSHGTKERAGYLEKRNGDVIFRPVEL